MRDVEPRSMHADLVQRPDDKRLCKLDSSFSNAISFAKSLSCSSAAVMREEISQGSRCPLDVYLSVIGMKDDCLYT